LGLVSWETFGSKQLNIKKAKSDYFYLQKGISNHENST